MTSAEQLSGFTSKNDPRYVAFVHKVNEAKTNSMALENLHKHRMECIKLMPLEWFVEAIRKIPDTAMTERGLNIDFDNLSAYDQLFAVARMQYRAKADWLRYLLLDETHLLDELRLTNKADYKPHAELSRTWLELAIQTIALCKPLEEYAGRAGYLLWLIEYEMFEIILEKNGFTKPPDPKSKQDSYVEAIDMGKQLSNPEKLVKQKGGILHSPSNILLNEAALLASVPKNVKFRCHWRDFLAKNNRYNREIRRSSLQTCYLEDSQIKYIGQGKRKRRD